jgi:hypothetical protein
LKVFVFSSSCSSPENTDSKDEEERAFLLRSTRHFGLLTAPAAGAAQALFSVTSTIPVAEILSSGSGGQTMEP